MPKKLFTIAFDLGGVIFAASNDTNIFCQNYLDTALNPGIMDIIKELSQDKSIKLIVLSKAYPNNARKSREVLRHYGLDEYFNSIIFCEKREQKFPICQAMEVNVMIDDREDVLSHFDDSIKTILFTPDITPNLYHRIISEKPI